MSFKPRSLLSPNPVMLAPMSGITDAPFRGLALAHGAGIVVSEMIASEQLACSHVDQLRKASGAGDISPLVIQLAGRQREWMAAAARVAVDLGADVIDINMGCPAKQVTNGASGAALMRDLDHACRLIEATVSAVEVPVTLKMRLGWDDASRNAAALARRAQDLGVAKITVHGRTRCQFYDGRADWRAIAKVVRAVAIPVIANGDINSVQDAGLALEQSGACGVMIGRGACGAPWFPGQVAEALKGGHLSPPSREQQWRIVRGHYLDMLSHYGRELGMRCARKHLAWYIEKALGVAATDARARFWRAKICTANNRQEVLGGLDAFYSDLDRRCAA